jgi:small basic protein
MCLAGLTAAAALQGVWPALLDTVFDKLLIVSGVALGAALLALAIGYFLGKRAGR